VDCFASLAKTAFQTDRYALQPPRRHGRRFRYLRDFWLLLRREWRSVDVRVGEPLLKSVEGTPLRSRLEDARILDPDPEREQLKAAYAAFCETFPAVRGVPVAQEWAGVIDATPDAVPVISPVDSHPGLIVATGFSGHGFGPGAGRLVADLVTGATPMVDPTPFRHARFLDGTKPRPTTGVYRVSNHRQT
jgi:glycine/D-amino acid oxidase-like deaminating enzyme